MQTVGIGVYIREFSEDDRRAGANSVLAEDIRAAIRDGLEVRIRNAVIVGTVDIESVVVDAKLAIRDSTIDGRFEASYAEFKKIVDFQGTTFAHDLKGAYCAEFRAARFESELIIRNARFSGAVGFRYTYLFRFEGQDATYEQDIALDNTVVVKGMNSSRAVFKDGFRMNGRIGADLDFRGVQFLSQKKEVNFNGTDIAGNAEFSSIQADGTAAVTRFNGDVHFEAIKVGGNMDFQGVKFTNSQRRVDYYAAQIAGNAYFNSVHVDNDVLPTVFSGESNFDSMKVDGYATFKGCQFTNSGKGLSLHKAEIGGTLAFSSTEVGTDCIETNIDGTADFTSLRVGEHLAFEGVQFNNRQGGVDFSWSRIAKDAYFSTIPIDNELVVTTFGGEADFYAIEVGGDVYFCGAQFVDPDSSVSFNKAQILGSATFDSFWAWQQMLAPTEFAGSVYFETVDIGEFATWRGVKFSNKEKGVSFYGTQIGRDLSITAARNYTHTVNTEFIGPAVFAAIEVKGDMNLWGADFYDIANFDSTTVTQRFLLRNTQFAAGCSIQDAHIGLIVYHADLDANVINADRDGAGPSLDMRGTEYKRIVPESAWKMIIASFDTRPDKYDRQPYAQLEVIFRDAGNDEIANEVYIESRKIETQHKKIPLQSNNIGQFLTSYSGWLVERWFLRPFTGYGVKTRRLFWLILPIWFIGLLIFAFGPGSIVVEQGKAILPSIPIVYENLCEVHALGWQDAAIVSLNEFLPINLPIGKALQPSLCPFIALDGLNLVLRYVDVANTMTILGWILIPVGIASLTGLLKR